MLIALVPPLASLDYALTILLLMGGLVVYSAAEGIRYLGFSVPLISGVTSRVLRDRERGHYALGPVTLGLGALLTLILFPFPIAQAALLVLAFGDSAASIVGNLWGRLRPPFLGGKSLEGTLAATALSAALTYWVLADWRAALVMGLGALLSDLLPLGDFDNLVLPLLSGLGASLLMGLA